MPGAVRRAAARAALLLAGLAVATWPPARAGAQMIADTRFGQNHVQYRNFRWKVLETEHFQIHYYPEIAEAAIEGARMAERSYARLSRLMNHRFREKKPLIFYATRGDFGQNNITGDLGEGTGAVAEGLRHRALIPFTGDFKSFEHVLQHELTHVMQYDIFARGRAGQGLQALASVQPPLWFMEGMPEYLYYGGRLPYLDMIMRDAAVNGRIPSIEAMTNRPDLYFPYTYGHALWAYVGQRWGDEAIGEIMNALPSLGIERAFRRELGLSLSELGEEWKEHLQAKYLPQIAEKDRPRKFAQALLSERKTGGAPFFVAPSFSPDGKYLAYIGYGSFLRGEVFPDLWLADGRTGKRLTRLVKSTTNPDFEELRLLYSQSAFSPDGATLAFTAQKGGRDVLYLVDVKSRRIVKTFDEIPLDGVTGPTWSPDGQRLAFSGNRGGITDLYVVNRDGTGFRALTHDRHGDVMPQWSPDGSTIAWTTDRGPETDFDILRFSPMQLALYDVASGAITVVPGQRGQSINPQWAPDGKSIAYVSDRTGILNIFLYDLTVREHYRLTNVMTGISSLTDVSPALTWARGADRLAFVHFDNGEVSVWSIANPRQLKREPWRDPVPATSAPVVAAADTAPAPADAVVPGAPVTLDPAARRVSLYRSPGGMRPSASIPALRAPADGGPVTVLAMADSADFALPDPDSFRRYDYRTSFEPEFVAQPTIGYAQDNFGRGLFGGTAIVFGDLMGDSRLAFAGAINGRIQEAQLYGSYTQLGGRLQYQIGVTQQPLFLYEGNSITPNPDGFTFTERQSLLRLVQRGIFAAGFYPLNRFSRFELGAQFVNLQQDRLRFDRVIDVFGQLAAPLQPERIESIGSTSYVSPFAAYVSDNTLMGYTGPISGRRFRLQASPTLGNLQWNEYMADYRRYTPILFNFLTLATRVSSTMRMGRDEFRFPQYIGRPFFVRGYDRENAFATACIPSLTGSAVGCSAQQLVGSRTVFGNAELRFPVVRRLDLGVLPISLPPLDGLLFFDAGAAWSRGQTLSLRRPTDVDPTVDRQRWFLSSYGLGLRLNLFGLALVRWDYAIPLADPQRRGYWVWTLGPSF
jgi:hypothetical protein